MKGTASVNIPYELLDGNNILIERYPDHLIGSPLALASKEYASKAWTRFEDIPALRASGLNWVRGIVVRVDCERKVAFISDSGTGEEYEEDYDYLVASSGLRRAWPAVPQSLRRESYLSEVSDHIDKVKNAPKGVVVIGGGG
jgi:NADPH-dependent 2,4-dienoyl-CoA reductase/sulfur reductase-like enzyme